MRLASVVQILFCVSVLLVAAAGQQPVTTAPTGTSPIPQTPDTQSQSAVSDVSQQGAIMSADDIINILQHDPAAMSDLKNEISAQMRGQGQSSADLQISDDFVFSKIKSDDQVRTLASAELKNRGYVGRTAPQVATEPPRQPIRIPQPAPPTQPPPEKPTNKAPSFYDQIPALKDLYQQLPVQKAPLERFGAQLFKNSAGVKEIPPSDIPVGPDYVLGVGDAIDVNVWGSTTQQWRRRIDAQGRVTLPEAGPLMLAGKTLDEAKTLINTALKRQLVGINTDVSLAAIRTVRVYVVGDIARPGAYDITSLSTPLNALYAAGGPTDEGSLRVVRHYRGNRLLGEFDLYDLLLHGVRGDVQRLESGDSILVPPAGPQVTVAGMVRRPAIYELHGEKSLGDVIELAGGVLVSGSLGHITVERVEPHKNRTLVSLDTDIKSTPAAVAQQLGNFSMQDGDVVTIRPIMPFSEQSVYLEGHVFRPGKEPYREGMTVRDVVRSYADLLPEPSDRADIIRLVPPEMKPVAFSFDLRGALNGTGENPQLQPFDTLHIYGRYEADPPKVSIYGEVMRPGEYPLTEGMTAAQLLQLAGGFKRSAFRDSADLASYVIEHGERVSTDHREVPLEQALSGVADTDVRLKPGDVLTIRQLTGWEDIGASIAVSGEVFHPGTYGIQEGERLSSVLRRAGGFRPTAYPNGAVLERVQVREMDKRTRETLVRRIRGSRVPVESPNVSEQSAISAEFAAQQQQIISRLIAQPPNGRLVVHVTEDISKWENTPADIEVRAGDQIMIPKRPGFVMVSGQVNNPTAITYVPGQSAAYYLQHSGGVTSFGNKKDVFIVRANGMVVGRSGSGWWKGDVLGTTLQPGDSVVVPEKIIGGGIMQRNLLNTAQVLANLAIAAKVAFSF